MTDYTELIKALRGCVLSKPCDPCPYYDPNGQSIKCATINIAAADAIEELSRAAEVNAKRALKWAADAEKAEEKLRWIPVTERLPETARDVLVAFRLPIEKTYLITKTQRASWSEKRKHDAFYQRGVTHWMEMPEPPKEET